MKKLLIALAAVMLTTIFAAPVQAVENGEDATGSAFAVPISIDNGNG